MVGCCQDCYAKDFEPFIKAGFVNAICFKWDELFKGHICQVLFPE